MLTILPILYGIWSNSA